MSSPSLQFPDLDAAIAQFEGFGKPGTLATRQNNPGNLVYGPFAARHGAVLGDRGFASFPDVASGVQAMDSLLQHYASEGLTQNEAIAKWNGNGPNTPGYQDFVTGKTGTPGSSVLDSLKKYLPWLGGPVGAIISGPPEPAQPAAEMLWKNITVTRFVAFIVGVVGIIAGLFFLKPTQDIVINAAKKVKDVAAVAA